MPRDTYLVVDFFFCLSGFVLAFAYEERLRSGMTLQAFVKARVFRLYPVFALGLALGLASYRSTAPIFQHRELSPGVMMFGSAVLNFLMLPTVHSVLFVFDGPLWTVFFDLLASVLFGVLVKRRMAGNGVLVAIMLVSLSVLVWQRVVFGTINFGPAWNSKSWGFSRAGVSFFAGVLCLRFYRFRRPARLEGWAAQLGAVALTVLFVLALRRSGPESLAAPFQLGVITIFFPALCYAGARLDLRGRTSAFCGFLGMVAYPVYALHVPVLALLQSATPLAGLPPRQFAAGFAVVVAVAAWATGRFYEAPIRAWLTRRFGAPVSMPTGAMPS